MFRIIVGFAAGFAAAKYLSCSSSNEKFKNIAKKCKTAVKEEFQKKEENNTAAE